MDDWDTVTKIGSKTRGGGGEARETVVRGKSALNAAQRSGAVIDTQKKFGAGNSSTKAGVDGQRLAAIDRNDGIVKPVTVGKKVGEAISKRRGELTPTLTRVELGKKCGMTPNLIADFENGTAAPDQKNLGKLEFALGIKLRGNDIGSPKFPPKKK